MSNIFASVEGITIEKYCITYRIEFVKKLILEDELTFSEIADQTGYSSVHHLSTQFKKITGFTPSSFKKKHKINHPNTIIYNFPLIM